MHRAVNPRLPSFPIRFPSPGVRLPGKSLSWPSTALIFGCVLAATPLWAGGQAATKSTATEPNPPAATSGEIATFVEALNADRFDVRQRAIRRLEQLAQMPGMQAALAEELERLLLRAETSFDVRSIVEPLLAKLPRSEQEPSAASEATGEDVNRLVAQADAPSYSLRVGAAVRLDWLAENPKLAWPIASRVKRRLADPGLSSESYKRLLGICEKARVTWLATDPSSWPDPAVSDERIAQWVNELAQSPGDEAARQAARQEVLDLLAHDNQVARVQQALERKRDEGIADVAAAERIDELIAWTRPGMVAEIWSDHQVDTLQYLLVDVPQKPETAPRPTHFDRIDDRVAHCVSGNSLASGDYPVEVGLPPTHTDPAIRREGVMFHLVNLPTPRRRLLFEYRHLRVPESKRLVELSERTTAWMLTQKRPLSQREIALLVQLDFGAVSRFAGPYLRSVDDVAGDAGDDEFHLNLAGRSSRHAMLCFVLAEVGTREAAPGLIEAIKNGRFLAPTPNAPYQLPWIAALSIARRDPWRDCDAWLAGLVERTDALVTIGPESADTGATAAATLLARHHVSPADFGLVEVGNEQLQELGCPGFRFQTAERRGDVSRWWQQQKARLAQRGPA